jgi:hypothetical protein
MLRPTAADLPHGLQGCRRPAKGGARRACGHGCGLVCSWHLRKNASGGHCRPGTADILCWGELLGCVDRQHPNPWYNAMGFILC